MNNRCGEKPEAGWILFCLNRLGASDSPGFSKTGSQEDFPINVIVDNTKSRVKKQFTKKSGNSS